MMFWMYFPPCKLVACSIEIEDLSTCKKGRRILRSFQSSSLPILALLNGPSSSPQKKAIVRSLWKELVKTGSRTRLRLLRMTRWEMGAGLAILLFFCFALLGCAWQPCQPITSVTTERHFMVFLTVTAMWKYHICCSAPWVTSWQKSYRKQKMKRNIWSTLSLLCRGESWIWSIFFFYLVCAHWAACSFSGWLCRSSLATKTGREGGKGGGKKKVVSGTFVSFHCLFCGYCLLFLWDVRRKTPTLSHPPKQKGYPTSKLLNVWLAVFLFSVLWLRTCCSQDRAWISWSSFRFPNYYFLQSLGWFFLFLSVPSQVI